jgi:hypothetical protein
MGIDRRYAYAILVVVIIAMTWLFYDLIKDNHEDVHIDPGSDWALVEEDDNGNTQRQK